MEELRIKSIKKIEKKSHVYDISVKHNHNFFIGNKEILTHNCDFLSTNAQAALRNLMETFSRTTRFILTANYVEKIIEPIQSRCQTFEVIPPNKVDIANHVANILKSENVSFNNEDLVSIINSNYPDIRKIINTCQLHNVKGKLQIDKQSIIEYNYMFKILEFLNSSSNKQNKFANIRQIIADSKVRQFEPLFRFIYDKVDKITSNITKQAAIISIIAESQFTDSMVVDKEINVMAMFVKIIDEL